MTREMLVKIATRTLQRRGVPDPAGCAEEIAQNIDVVIDLVGGSAVLSGPPALAPSPDDVGFPKANPLSVRLAPEPEEPALNMISTDTRMPSPAERTAAASQPEIQPIRSLRQQKLKPEELNLIIQQSTPETLVFDVPVADGSRRVTFKRNVLSRHAEGAVTLEYSPMGTRLSGNSVIDDGSVQASISVEEWPVDLNRILNSLTAQAINSLRPRGPIISVPPVINPRPVQSDQTYPDGASPKLDTTETGKAQNLFQVAAESR